MQRVEVVTAVSLGDIAVGISQVPLSTRIAGIVARRGLRIHPELRHQARTHVVIVKVSTNSKLRDANFVRAEDLARSADRIVFRMVEIVVIDNVSSNFGRKKLGIKSGFLRAWIAVQPRPVRKREGLGLRRFCCGRIALRRHRRNRLPGDRYG